MTALTHTQKERQRFARSRAGQIRAGITNYIHTLGVIAQAYQERDWETLGYESWQQYIDGEFPADRLGIPAEYREKAMNDLRLAGLSTRAIAPVVGVSHSTVARQVSQDATPDAEVRGVDGKTYAAKSPLVEAMTGAIEDADERAKNPGVAAPAPAEASSPAGPHGKPAVGGNAGVEVPPASTPAPQDHPGSFSADPGETESAGNTSEPGGPVLTARVGTSTAAGAVTPAAPAAPQGQERSEGFRCPACLRPLGAAA